jgi:hypothetical protein
MRQRWLTAGLCFVAVLLAAVVGPRLVRSLPSEPRQMSSERPPAPPGAGRPTAPSQLPRPLEAPTPAPATPPGPPPAPPPPRPRLAGPPRPSAPGSANEAPDHKQRGVSLGLFAEDVSFDYAPLLTEIAQLGASHVALVVPIYQEHGGSTRLRLHTRLSPSLQATAETVRAARRVGLEVMLFPIIRLQAPRTPNEWRGTLAPENLDAWFDSYLEILGDLAAIGGVTGATRLAIGSELSSLDGEVGRWTRVIERVRAVFPGTLIYSANWDHYQQAKLLDLVDEAGIVAYFELRAKDGPGDLPALERRWRELRGELLRWRAGRKQPLVFTEVGYRSRTGASASPWDESSGGEPDLEEQRRAFEAFRRVWASAPEAASTPAPGGPASAGAPGPGGSSLAGLYVWNWYGWGGPSSSGYTPRGKPAAEEVRRLLLGL